MALSYLSSQEWDEFLSRYPNAHLLQTSRWGDLKSEFGWETAHLRSGDTGVQVLFRRLPLGFSIGYVPKGPPWQWRAPGLGEEVAPDPPVQAWQSLWEGLDTVCRKKRCVFLKVEPDIRRDATTPPLGFLKGEQTIQPATTIVVDITGYEDRVLAQMKQKTRYNIRLAQRKGVVVRRAGDIDAFFSLLEETGNRDAFGIHSREYYQRAYEIFHPNGECELLLAEYEHEPLAALMVFAHGDRAWYFYGASSNSHRDRMPTYLLQWEAMRWAREKGCASYDLWGVPDADEQSLEEQFTERSDGLWGVYRFKRGFGGEVVHAAGPWDRVYIPSLYNAYRMWLGRRQVTA